MTNIILEIAKIGSSASSMFMCLSPAPSMLKIHRRKACGEVVVLPLLSLWGNCHLWMLYGYLTENIFPVFLTFGTGELLAIAYLIVYYRHTSERAEVRRLASWIFAGLLLVTLYALSGDFMLGITSQSKKSTSVVVGYIAVTVCLLLFASPLATLRRVIQTKSAASFPILMCVVGFFGNSLWVTYGAMIDDMFMCLSNVVCVALGFVQIVVYIIYNPNKIANHEGKELLEVVVASPNSNTSTEEADAGSGASDSDDSTSAAATGFYVMRSPRSSATA
ncbi:hypothetical protein PybrP1_009154 [[Pythium] brassicae (nom. inval.)]|nr:hypothetical protein PybrP1_009154 [[Pythium] brassicae (nom. inval.)]